MAAAGDPRRAGVHETTSNQFLGVSLCLFQHSTPTHNTSTVSCPWWDSASTSHSPTQTSAGIYIFMVFSLVFYLI